MTRRLRSRAVWVLVAVATGCATSPRPTAERSSPAAGLAEIAYEVDGGSVLPLAVGLAEREATPLILPAGFDDSAAEAPADGREPASDRPSRALRTRLELRRNGRTVLARLEFYDRSPEPSRRAAPARSRSAAASRRAKPPEPIAPVSNVRPVAAYELDLSPAELSLVLDDLEKSGAFGSQRRPEGGARLSLREVDQGVQKQWTPEPRLDDIAERVLKEGRRVAAAPAGGRTVTARQSSP